MKRNIIIVFLLSMMLWGCEDTSLNITPDGRITLKDAFNDPNMTESYLNSCYSKIPAYAHNYVWLAMSPATCCDEAQDGSDPGNSNQSVWNDGGLSPNNNPWDNGGNDDGWMSNLYGRWWRGIRLCNVFLENIDNAKIFIENNRGRFKAEAHVLRAFYYMEMCKMYGGMPIVKASFPLDYDWKKFKRNTMAECADFIASDCDSALAEPMLPWRITNGSEEGRFTKAVAYTIKCEALLYAASPLYNPTNDKALWQKAYDAAKQAIADLTSHGYTLYPDYDQYFTYMHADYSTSPNDKETIYEIDHGGVWGFQRFWAIMCPPSCDGGVKAGTCPTQELVDAYDMQSTGLPPILGYSDEQHLHPIINGASGYDENNPYVGRDPRFYASILYNGVPYGQKNGKPYNLQCYSGGDDGISATLDRHSHTGYYLRKYIDPTLRNNDNGNSHWKKYRLAEIYLDLAEAANETGNNTQDAYDALKVIRDRVHMPNVEAGLNQTDLRNRIHKERMVEMAFEESRFFDLRRWKELSAKDRVKTAMRWTLNQDGSLTNQRVITRQCHAYDDKFLLFPIPQDECDKLGGASAGWQNPGW